MESRLYKAAWADVHVSGGEYHKNSNKNSMENVQLSKCKVVVGELNWSLGVHIQRTLGTGEISIALLGKVTIAV